jgi:hypothetical protein
VTGPRLGGYVALDDPTKGGAVFGLVGLDRWGKPTCAIHGAMNKVSPRRRGGLWRCLQGTCRAGCRDDPYLRPLHACTPPRGPQTWRCPCGALWGRVDRWGGRTRVNEDGSPWRTP